MEVMEKLNLLTQEINSYQEKMGADFASKSALTELSSKIDELQLMRKHWEVENDLDSNSIFKGRTDVGLRAYNWWMEGPLKWLQQRGWKPEFMSDVGADLVQQFDYNTATPAQGGFLTFQEYSKTFYDLLAVVGFGRKYHPVEITSAATVHHVGTDDDFIAYFQLTEGTTKVRSSPELWEVNISPEVLYALAVSSVKLIWQSRIALVEMITRKLAHAVAWREDFCIARGNGVADAINGGVTGYCRHAQIPQVVSGNDPYGGLVDLTIAVHETITTSPNAKYFMSRNAFSEIVKLRDTTGQPIVHQNPEDPTKLALNGYPIVIFDQLGAACSGQHLHEDQDCILFGDLSQAAKVILNKDISVSASEHERFSRNQVVFRAEEGFSFAVIQPQAVSRLCIQWDDKSASCYAVC